MKFDGLKRDVKRFLLGESGGMSRNKIISVGIIGFLTSASSVVAYDACDCRSPQWSEEKIVAGSSSDLVEVQVDLNFGGCTCDGSRTYKDASFTMNDLARIGILNDWRDEGFELRNGDEPIACGPIDDHLNMGGYKGDCDAQSHFNSDNSDSIKVIKIPNKFFHSNSMDISSSNTLLSAEHTHNAIMTGERTLKCHMDDHWSGGTGGACDGHRNGHISGPS